MLRALALALVLATAAAVSADDWTDKTVKLRVDTKLGTKQAGGLLRDGAELKQGQGFTVKSDDGQFIEFVGETGFLFKNEVELFVGREMPKKGAAPGKADPKDLWVVGSRVLPKRNSSQIQFGDRDEKGRSTFFTLTGLSFVVQKDNGDGWVRVRDRYREGWVHKDDLLTKDTAFDHFDAAVKANPNDNWVLFMRAASNHERGKYDECVADYTEYLKKLPNTASAINNRGNAYVSKKDYDKAIEDYTAVLALDPKYTLAYSNRSSAWLGKKEYQKAIDDCDKAIELDPKYGTAYWYRARALAKLKRYDEAGKGFETAAKLDPTAARFNSQAWFLATCPDEKYRDGKKALELAKKALEQVGQDAAWGFRDTLAAAHAETGDFEAAVAELTKALEAKETKGAKPPTADERKKMETRLELYKAKKPFRDDE